MYLRRRLGTILNLRNKKLYGSWFYIKVTLINREKRKI